MKTYVPFDADWYAIGYIEPEFVTEVTGWATEQILCDVGMLPVKSYASFDEVLGEVPAWVPEAFTREPLPVPKPIRKTTLRWVWAA